MKNETSEKITALSVVIFSFVALLIYAVIWFLLNSVTDLLVLKTDLSESALKIGSVISNGIGLVISTAYLVSKSRIKGIYGAGIVFLFVVMIKIIGNSLMGLGGYLNLNGLIGILFTAIFTLVGGTLGGIVKKR